MKHLEMFLATEKLLPIEKHQEMYLETEKHRQIEKHLEMYRELLAEDGP